MPLKDLLILVHPAAGSQRFLYRKERYEQDWRDVNGYRLRQTEQHVKEATAASAVTRDREQSKRNANGNGQEHADEHDLERDRKPMQDQITDRVGH